ncbi:receptor-interacting serine/threonine-protein kinase 2-like [Heterodontus francisci]|uniref:receptor-interacting serine/threonine-protein kinase 2-like n=1 Tax=Heterodontus francisci TaxID=7792 RepID=UPI00355C96B7
MENKTAALGQETFQDITTANTASLSALIDYKHLTNWKIIGSGGFGDVYKARHQMWGVPVAIKSLRMNGSDEHDLVKEAKKMYKAQFEYILRLYGVTKWCLRNGITSLGLVTEFMDNGSLDKFLCYYKVPWPLRLRFAYEIALGMNFLHNLKPALFHHDLKTANILLNKDYRIKICDFGLAKWRKPTGQNSYDCNRNEGTVSYIPPECFESINARKGVKFDVYSYGIVIWEILSCQKPYKNAVNSQHLKVCVEKGDRPDLQEIPALRPESSDVLIDLMKRCWHANPDERPTFARCVYELEQVQSNEQELRLAIQTLTKQESQSVDGSAAPSSSGYSEDYSALQEPVEEQNEHINLIEPVPETNFIKELAEAAQNTSQEEIVKSPLASVTSDECMELAKLLNKDWKTLGRYLSLTEGDIHGIDHDCDSHGLDEKAYQVLDKWKQQQGKNANREKLVFHLKKIGRNDVAMKFCH